MSKTEIYGYSVIAVFLPVLIFLVFILWSMYRTGFSYGRQIPMPPEHLRPKNRGVPKMRNPPPPPFKPCLHGFAISEVMNLEIDPCCKNCGEKLSELKESINLKK